MKNDLPITMGEEEFDLTEYRAMLRDALIFVAGVFIGSVVVAVAIAAARAF